MTGSFVLDYSILVFFASSGVFQMAAACNGLNGLQFFPDRRHSFLLGLILLVAGFAWFFLSEPRNVPDTSMGLTGNQQFAFFFIGSGTGLTFTLVLSSLRNRGLGKARQVLPEGIDALRESNYFRALFRTLAPWWPFPSARCPLRSRTGRGDSGAGSHLGCK